MSVSQKRQTYAERSRRGDVASAFAAWLAEANGHHAEVLPKSQCPPNLPWVRDWYKDDGDIVVGKWMVQTKWPTVVWTQRSDFPFKYMMVDEWHKAQKSVRRGAVAYWVFSGNMKSLAICKTAYHRHWIQEGRYNGDPDQKRTIEYAMCPLDLIEWRPITPEIVAEAVAWGVIPPPYSQMLPYIEARRESE